MPTTCTTDSDQARLAAAIPAARVVAAGAALLGVAPVLEQDCDLRCMVLGQRDATTMPADAMLWSAVRR